MTNVVVVSLEAWDEVWRRNQHLVARLLNADPRLRVLFVEPPVDPVHVLRHHRGLPRLGRGLRPVHDPQGLGGDAPQRLWLLETTKWLPRRIDPSEGKRWAKAIVRAASRLGMREPVLWVNDPRGAEVMDRSGWKTMYDITDDWAVADRPARALAQTASQEKALLAGARAVVVCSPELLQRKSSADGALHLIGNAVDPEPYQRRQQRPPDLPAGRVALYAGSIHPDRIDVPLLVEVGLSVAGAGTAVLVGPHDLSDRDVRSLESAGVVLLGPQPASRIPAYLQHADVLLVPHIVSEFTSSLDPIKAYEYSAAGRPVISTCVPGFVDSLDPSVLIAERGQYSELVRKTLSTGGVLPSAGPIRVPTWEERAGQMAGVLSSLMADQ